MAAYKTSEIAHMVGLHPNTVRLYEDLNFIARPKRQPNGYRVYTDLHVEQIKFARLALKSEVLQNGLRKQAIHIITVSAAGDYDIAIEQTKNYLGRIINEEKRAEEAIEIVNNILDVSSSSNETLELSRKQTAEYINVSIDALRNWEMNGLLTVKRKKNGYRIYNEKDIRRLKIIYCLRSANYSLTAILRMLNDLESSSPFDLKKSIDNPKDSEYIISVCDRLLTSLKNTENNAIQMLQQLEYMKTRF